MIKQSETLATVEAVDVTPLVWGGASPAVHSRTVIQEVRVYDIRNFDNYMVLDTFVDAETAAEVAADWNSGR